MTLICHKKVTQCPAVHIHTYMCLLWLLFSVSFELQNVTSCAIWPILCRFAIESNETKHLTFLFPTEIRLWVVKQILTNYVNHFNISFLVKSLIRGLKEDAVTASLISSNTCGCLWLLDLQSERRSEKSGVTIWLVGRRVGGWIGWLVGLFGLMIGRSVSVFVGRTSKYTMYISYKVFDYIYNDNVLRYGYYDFSNSPRLNFSFCSRFRTKTREETPSIHSSAGPVNESPGHLWPSVPCAE